MRVREMLPERGKRVNLPKWEVSNDDGQVIGWVSTVLIPGCRTTFYGAEVLDSSGRKLDLELTTDREERLKAVVMFQHHPEHFARHFA